MTTPLPPPAALGSWDIFCTIIDNFGDIGVCWRLARQLADEHGHAVRLWVDDLDSFARLAPALDVKADAQHLAGIEIRRWTPGASAGDQTAFASLVPHDVVVEAFACTLPEAFLARMTERPVKPVWINLEYLSAEPWVREHHGMASPHPRLPLVKYFFFPGFEPGTGGLLRESMLGTQRALFLDSPAAQARLWHRLGITPLPGALKVSLFAYPNAALPPLLAQWRDSPAPTQCLIPAGAVAEQAFGWAGVDPAPGASFTCGNLHAHIVPFVRQEEYDETLWACDLNFVRGEDSFVRAQWAERPFIWHIYPQEDEAHRIKLDAFLALYLTRMEQADSTAANTLARFWHAWNGNGAPPDWAAFHDTLVTQRHAIGPWARSLRQIGDLAANLVAFCENRVK
jgi:uncharacterized repeat protein (TIGR03837 family)